MSILGMLIDKTTVSRAHDDLKGLTYASLAHSLPATNPEVVLPIMRSVEELTWKNTTGMPMLLGDGGNASLATYGLAMGSGATTPTIMFDVYSIVFHTRIR
jgi:hypothetical protein